MTDWLKAIFLDTQPALLFYFRGKLGCPDQAKDLAQDAWLRLARLENPDDLQNPRGYLFRVAENLVTDQLRKRLLRPPEQWTELKEDLICPAPQPDRQAQLSESTALLVAAIDELPPKCKQAFLLHRLEGLTYSQIAARQGISVKTVEKHLRKALDHCRARLGDGGIES